MKPWKYSLLALCLGLSLSVQAELLSGVDRTQLEQGESLTLSINIRDLDGDQLDLSPLEKSFDILGRSHQSSTIIRNGQMQSRTELILTLLPKDTGEIEIPPLSLAGETTKAHKIKVTTGQTLSATEGGLEIISSLSSEAPYLQQPIVYHANLLVGQKVYNASLQAPEVRKGQAIIEPLGEQKQYKQVLKGRELMVVEQAWLITPEQSGPLEISPVRLIAQVPTGRPDPFRNGVFINQSNMKHIQVQGEGYQLEVASIPPAFDATDWLAAESLTLTEQWGDGAYKVGEPITRTLKLEVVGISEHQLPTLTLPEVDGVSQYQGVAETEQRYQDMQLIASLTQEVTLIPSKAGELTLPELTLHWWDTRQHKEQVTKLPARTLQVAQGVAVQQPVPPTAPAPVVANPTPSQSSVAIPEPHLTVEPSQPWAPYAWALLGAVLGSLVTLLVGKKLALKKAQVPEVDQLSNSNPSAALKQLKLACQQNSIGESRQALLNWSQHYWPQCRTLNQLSAQVAPALQEEISRLQQAGYSQSVTEWQGEQLWQVVQQQSLPSLSNPSSNLLAELYLAR